MGKINDLNRIAVALEKLVVIETARFREVSDQDKINILRFLAFNLNDHNNSVKLNN